MAVRPRPRIPLSVKLQVAERQLGRSWSITGQSRTERLDLMLRQLFDGPYDLDHDPPLRARPFNEQTGKYTPDANDPDYLFYRSKEDHRVKTLIRGEHGQYPDRVLIKKERRRERKKKKRKYKWPTRKIRNAARWPGRPAKRVSP